jgi:hypothetical protein
MCDKSAQELRSKHSKSAERGAHGGKMSEVEDNADFERFELHLSGDVAGS